MGQNSKIQWTHHTFNPWRGCTKVSDGCKHCYAEALSKRSPKILGIWGPNGTRVKASDTIKKEVLKWHEEAIESGEQRRVFCGSLCDWLECADGLPTDAVDLVDSERLSLMGMIRHTPALTWLLLSKRLHNWRGRVSYACTMAQDSPTGQWIDSWLGGNPPANVWVGASIESQAVMDDRLSYLRDIPAVCRFLSVEPLLEEVRLDLRGINWVIVGGESGPKARECHIDWIRGVVKQCRAARVPVFVKQLGAAPLITYCDPTDEYEAVPIRLKCSQGGEMSEWPADLRVREFPQVEAI